MPSVNVAQIPYPDTMQSGRFFHFVLDLFVCIFFLACLSDKDTYIRPLRCPLLDLLYVGHSRNCWSRFVGEACQWLDLEPQADTASHISLIRV